MTNISWNTLPSNTTEETRILATPHYVSAVFLSLTQLFGVLGNVLVIYSIVSQRSLLKNNYYYLVLHLAICDLMVLVLSANVTYELWSPNSLFIRSFPMCKVWRPITTFFFNAGVYMVVLIGILRYRAVLHPFKPAISRSKLRVVVAAVYLCALTSLVPFILVYKFKDLCFEEWPNPTLYIIYASFFSTVQYFLPVVILSILYYKICKALKKQSKKIRSLNDTSAATSGDSNGRQTNLQMIKHCRNIRTFIYSVGIVVSFVITPFASKISWLISLVSGTTVQTEILTWTYIVLFFGVNAANPYIYGVSDKTLLSAYKRSWKKVKGIFVSTSN